MSNSNPCRSGADRDIFESYTETDRAKSVAFEEIGNTCNPWLKLGSQFF